MISQLCPVVYRAMLLIATTHALTTVHRPQKDLINEDTTQGQTPWMQGNIPSFIPQTTLVLILPWRNFLHASGLLSTHLPHLV